MPSLEILNMHIQENNVLILKKDASFYMVWGHFMEAT